MRRLSFFLLFQILLVAPAYGETVLFVVPNAGSLSTQDAAKKTLMESWSFSVLLISAGASQTNFDTAVGQTQVAYISEEVLSADLNTKLKSAPIGVVNEELVLTDEYGFSSSNDGYTSNAIDVTDNSHYITSPYSVGLLTICNSSQELHTATGTMAPGAQVLGERPSSSQAALVVIETGGGLYGGGTAAGRRVHLPWGRNNFDVQSLNAAGEDIMKRAIEWAGNLGNAIFTDVSVAKGFNVITTTQQTSGLHWGDLDDDGDLDVIITGFSFARRMINDNQGASFNPGAATGNLRRQGALVDLDNDGDLDFWIVNDNSYNIERYFENDGNAVFSNGGDLGFGNPTNNEGMMAADVNGDGWCDIVMFSTNGNWIGHHQTGTAVQLVGTADPSYGLHSGGNAGNGDYCSVGDINNDGFSDAFYHYNGGRLFRSNGDGTFTENDGGISVVTGNSDKMGSAWADYDNDGDLDLFVCRRDNGQRGYLWRQNSGGTFTDVTVVSGITNSARQHSCCWGDYDNDGDVDLYIVTGSASVNVMFENQGDGTFSMVTVGAEVGGVCLDAVFVDFDNDGDQDLAVTRENATTVLLENGTDSSSYLKVRVIGAGAGRTHRSAVGMRVEVYDASGSTLLGRREIGVARGLGSTEPLWLHFGGLDATTSYLVKAYFTSLPIASPLTIPVVPQNVSTVIGTTIIPQMLTITEGGLSITSWREVIK